LKNDLLKLTIRLEDLLEIRLGDTEMNVADIEPVEWRSVGTWSSAALRGPSGTVLLGFGKLRNDGDTFELLAGQLKSLGNRLFVLELNVTNAGIYVSTRGAWNGERDLPFGATGDTILDNLGFDNRANGLEEVAQVAGFGALRDLLYKDGALVPVVFGSLWGRRLIAAGVTTLASVATTTAVSRPVAVAVLVVAAISAGGAGSGTTAATVIISAGIYTATAGTTTVAIARVTTAGSVSIFICVSTFGRSATASISSPMISFAASTPVSI
jgi:hypothetical protein